MRSVKDSTSAVKTWACDSKAEESLRKSKGPRGGGGQTQRPVNRWIMQDLLENACPNTPPQQKKVKTHPSSEKNEVRVVFEPDPTWVEERNPTC